MKVLKRLLLVISILFSACSTPYEQPKLNIDSTLSDNVINDITLAADEWNSYGADLDITITDDNPNVIAMPPRLERSENSSTPGKWADSAPWTRIRINPDSPDVRIVALHEICHFMGQRKHLEAPDNIMGEKYTEKTPEHLTPADVKFCL